MSSDITKQQIIDIGKLITKQRKIKFPNDSQETFAARIGVGETTMNRIETGKGNVSIVSYLVALNTLELSDRISTLTSLNNIKETLEAPKW
ncbi:MAG: helix-turn-helix transcriptional regulator [Colwellia sp.]|nr:helix-turn-helix transcriptional regulator [Colwellia sp.]